MNYLAILLFTLVAEGSLANKTCNSSSILDLAPVLELYRNNLGLIPLPTAASGDNSATVFRDQLIDAIFNWGQSLFDIVVCQAVDAGDRLVDCIKKTTYKLQQSIQSPNLNKNKPISLDYELDRVTIQLKKVLELRPGNIQIERSVRPPMPEQQAEIQSRSTNRTLTELFLNFDTILYGIAVNGFGLLTAVYLAAWRIGRSISDSFQLDIRNKILNDKVLAACRIAVDKIYQQKDVIRKNVRPDTWECFKNAGDRIIIISNDYFASKNDDNYCSSCTDCPYR